MEELRAERAEFKRALSRAERAVREVREVRVPVEKIVERIIEVESVTPAEAEVREARARAEAAEARAERAIAAYEELSVSVSGRRDLSLTEARELSRNGPAGPAILAGALKALAVARKTGTTAEVRKALRDVASAAVSWSDRV